MQLYEYKQPSETFFQYTELLKVWSQGHSDMQMTKDVSVSD